MIQAVSEKLAARIKNTVPDHPKSEAVLAFSISFLLNTILIIVFSLIISLITGRIGETVTVLIAYALLRQLSGGLHLNSGVLCVIVSTMGVTALSFANFGLEGTLIVNLISVCLVAIFAPSRLEGTRIPQKHYPVLKWLSVAVVCTNFFFQSPVIAAAFLAQSLTLIHKKEVLRT